jgi:predicted kinase
MFALIFCGVQGCGKTTFYRTRFFDTHVRISLDMLRTRNREDIFLRACIEAKQPFVVDNTNPTVEERAKYLAAAKAGQFGVVGYYFESKIEDVLRRNDMRPEPQRVPRAGIFGTYSRLRVPTLAEGFDELYYVRIDEKGEFVVETWRDEV